MDEFDQGWCAAMADALAHHWLTETKVRAMLAERWADERDRAELIARIVAELRAQEPGHPLVKGR